MLDQKCVAIRFSNDCVNLSAEAIGCGCFASSWIDERCLKLFLYMKDLVIFARPSSVVVHHHRARFCALEHVNVSVRVDGSDGCAKVAQCSSGPPYLQSVVHGGAEP